uniref:Uncharacterized protein n=1 Tax=viral metagenome TaxID=1070528 RepID=A0A6M3KXA7_9ZZZZ
MDSSETYIKMRMAAIPDLGIGTPSLRPFHFVKAIPDLSKQVLIDVKGDWYHITKPGHECQLERQDQLQAMVKLNLPELEMSFHDFCLHSIYARDARYLLSMEQLWLAFVMKENYGKIWENEKWVVMQ